MKIPVYSFDERKARAAWDAHSELMRAMIRNPNLRDNPVWSMLRQDAYEHLCEAFGSIHG
ncbi:hypothetical protein [Novosphingobium sp. HII-3]|uniref:hypothetical protein n=1 Tax=Novosphingobium sp. HII-3 TaxID=2075565 RepID=UPI000CDA02A9|nr:hypothetical protein [Novosphingobium sp. HII-3]